MPDQTREPLRDVDLLAFEFVGDPQLSPDGAQVAFTRTTLDAKDNAYRSQIHVAPTDGSAPPKALTGGPRRDSQPRYSPDGRYLAFVSDREADTGSGPGGNSSGEDDKKLGPQIYILPLGGGEARRVTSILGGVGQLAWSPDSTRLAFVTRIKPAGAEFFAGGAKASDSPKPDPDSHEALYAKYNKDVRYITRIRYRLDGFGWFEDRRAQVFVLDVEQALAADASSLPQPVQITGGPYDHSGPSWTPDGRRIAVSACRAPDPDIARMSDVWLFPADGSASGGPGYDAPRGGNNGGGPADPAPTPREAQPPTAEPVMVTASNGNFHGASFSPDGRTVAMLGHTKPKAWYSDTHIWLADLAADGTTSNLRCLTGDHPRSMGDESGSDMRTGGGDNRPVWSADGRHIYMQASDRGTTHLYRIDAATGQIGRLTSGDIVLFNLDVNPGAGRAAFAVATPENPNDIYVADLAADAPTLPALADPTQAGGLHLRKLTRCNEELLSKRRVVTPERFNFHAEGGPEVDGWAWKPLDAQPGRAYPTVLEIHGGPMSMYTGTFFMEFQLLLAQGIGVVITNPRGSQGYGQDFCAGIQGNWGKNDYDDIMAGMDTALARFPWIDRERLGVAGGSYGGYMTSWIIGHTQRFKAACVMRPVTNCYSFFGSSDGGFHWDEVWGRDMPPWENPEDYLRQSPIAYAGNMRTPTLIIHSEMDYRCLVEQGEQLYAALKKQGVEAEFLRYQGEPHGLSRMGKPWHRIHRLRAIAGWFASHL
jgi:dipeptidyl aminopeptidase/acylaminoacyl peptidase